MAAISIPQRLLDLNLLSVPPQPLVISRARSHRPGETAEATARKAEVIGPRSDGRAGGSEHQSGGAEEGSKHQSGGAEEGSKHQSGGSEEGSKHQPGGAGKGSEPQSGGARKGSEHQPGKTTEATSPQSTSQGNTPGAINPQQAARAGDTSQTTSPPRSLNGYTIEVEVFYDKALQSTSDAGDGTDGTSVTDISDHTRQSLRFTLDSNLQGTAKLADVDYPSTIDVRFLGPDGIPRVVKTADVIKDKVNGVTVTLTEHDVHAILAKVDLPPASSAAVTRTARFVEVDFSGRNPQFDFARAKLLTAPLQLNQEDKPAFFEPFEGNGTSRVFTQPFPGAISDLPWTVTRLAVDGTFTSSFVIPTRQNYNAWAWLLLGNRAYGMIGIVSPDELDKEDTQVRAIILPAPPLATGPDSKTEDGEEGTSSKQADCKCDTDMPRVPAVVSEAELANNPSVYTEDPGTSCKPFRNPERVISEKALFSVLRVEQPEISGSASGLIKNPILDFEQDLFVPYPPTTRPTINPLAPITTSVPASSLPHPWLGAMARFGSGRHEMNAQNPVQWEGDSLRYQATTIAKGHILEFRMRTRSNGYSLGGVAKTLELAPRQTRRTTEVIRNINYGHSLTVIYYNVLRHLRVDTEFAGARECLFIPFAIRPFTKERVLRWKDSISRALRRSSLTRALTYLKDVVTNFAYSTIPPGRRSDHPIKSLWGSLYIELGISRPVDKDDGKFDDGKWTPLLSFLPSPAFAIYQQLSALDTTIRDQIFQQRFAPAIATKWCDSLQISDRNGDLSADFTLATQYRFNGTARVDFQVSPNDGITRQSLASFRVAALKALPPGSKANINGVSLSYQTDFENGSLWLSRGVDDLITVETGRPDPAGAAFISVPSAYDRQDVRQELRLATDDLIQHVNEHVEYYHKAVWWNMDRDRLFMLLDGFTVPRLQQNQVSIANVVEKEPLAVAGNCLVYRVSAGVFLGNPELSITSPKDLYSYYSANKAVSDPLYISLPTDGLYARTIMDECDALEDHYGNKDWALSDPDPELGALDASLLQSRKSEVTGLAPTTLPSTIINLTNATPAPAPQGLGGVLGAAQNANAFGDMAGLAGTQQLASAGLQTAASLATGFGSSAAALEIAKMASKKQAVADADRKLASIQRAKDKGLVTDEDSQRNAARVLSDLNTAEAARAPHEDPDIKQLLDQFRDGSLDTERTFEASNSEGMVRVAFGNSDRDIRSAANTTGRGRRPSWSAFKALYWTYDKKKSTDVRQEINPAWADNPNYANTCCMRLSRALNEYGMPITKSAGAIPGVETERIFETDQRYIIKVNAAREYLLHQWGMPEVNVRKERGSPFKPAKDPRFKGKTGVIVFAIQFGGGDATGHVDLWDGKQFSHEMKNGWDEAGTDPKKYWTLATSIMLCFHPSERVTTRPATAYGVIRLPKHETAPVLGRYDHIDRIARIVAMAPPPQELEEALIAGTHRVFTADPDATTVNKVRHDVEQTLGLEEGFFTADDWKQRSKALIKEYVDKLLDGWVPDAKEEKGASGAKNGVKRQSPALQEPGSKRQKLVPEQGNLTKRYKQGRDADSAPKKPPKPAPRRKSKAATPEDEDDFQRSSPPAKKNKRESKDDGEDDSKSAGRDDTGSSKAAPPTAKDESDDGAESSINVEEAKPSVDEEEEYSDVIDEPPPPKRKKKDKKDAAAQSAKPATKKSSVKASSPDDPEDAEVKKLQGQLVKCGVRKLWHNELKKYGDDSRAKIRHLKKMLADVGMDGRFSEAKAREIRETRELMAEAEAAQEMNRLWGMGGGGRASRSKSKSMKLDEDSEGSGAEDKNADDDDKDDDDEEEQDTFAARRRRAQADLAFLGDDSDSD
ncbi:acetyl esterase [Purpureocillium lavendulum]|uniref:Acetyl esterase n=1 Tax=Purpureocillium lavendulum TaxID=1247861 RepID=A0AB34FPG0_9HYPO|nr:acetyl esterase [Purpureocillium lavendulum]